jgi:hypothetical protein
VAAAKQHLVAPRLARLQRVTTAVPQIVVKLTTVGTHDVGVPTSFYLRTVDGVSGVEVEYAYVGDTLVAERRGNEKQRWGRNTDVW